MQANIIEIRKSAISERAKALSLDVSGYKFIDFLHGIEDLSKHWVRYLTTFQLIQRTQIELTGTVLETGSYSPITTYLGECGAEIRKTTTDLRYKIDADDHSIDVVLSLEVLEHLKDHETQKLGELNAFNYSGAKRYASEIERILKPGGSLILTTPNPNSAMVLQRLIDGKAAMVFEKHVREFTKAEILDLFSNFTLESYTTMYNFSSLSVGAQAKAQEVFERNGWSTNDRGDDHFFHFRKR